MILVVDDESVTRRVVTHALSILQVEVMGAGSGEEALALAEQHHFDLAIVDIHLPDVDGFEVMYQLRQMQHLQVMPIIVFTARTHPGDDAAAAEVGASGFLYKPFSTQEIRELVTYYLRL
ncbi:MAG: hypothetical protein OHK0046_00560 [Anaerolineae bacterium]